MFGHTTSGKQCHRNTQDDETGLLMSRTICKFFSQLTEASSTSIMPFTDCACTTEQLEADIPSVNDDSWNSDWWQPGITWTRSGGQSNCYMITICIDIHTVVPILSSVINFTTRQAAQLRSEDHALSGRLPCKQRHTHFIFTTTFQIHYYNITKKIFKDNHQILVQNAKRQLLLQVLNILLGTQI